LKTRGCLHRTEIVESDDENLRDSEIALMDALKVAFDLMMYAGVKPAQIDKLLGSLTEQYRTKQMPPAAAVIEILRAFVLDRGREAHREQLQRIREEPPAGSA
jgi:hypothetical protein